MFKRQTLQDFLKKDINRTLLASLAFHCFLLLFFFWVNIGFEFIPPDFAEVSFVSGEPMLTGSQLIGSTSQLPREFIQKGGEQILAQKGSEKELVKIPKRRMLEKEEPQLLSREIEKRKPTEIRSTVPARRDIIAEGPDILPAIGERSRGEKISSGATRIHVAEKEVPGADIGTAGQSELPFRIVGEAAQRKILYKVIPKYPAGVQIEATVKVRFAVLPDGSVGEMIPVIKGNATLESLTLNALRQWRFDSLPASAPQREVEGIITFRYILR